MRFASSFLLFFLLLLAAVPFVHGESGTEVGDADGAGETNSSQCRSSSLVEKTETNLCTIVQTETGFRLICDWFSAMNMTCVNVPGLGDGTQDNLNCTSMPTSAETAANLGRPCKKKSSIAVIDLIGTNVGSFSSLMLVFLVAALILEKLFHILRHSKLIQKTHFEEGLERLFTELTIVGLVSIFTWTLSSQTSIFYNLNGVFFEKKQREESTCRLLNEFFESLIELAHYSLFGLAMAYIFSLLVMCVVCYFMVLVFHKMEECESMTDARRATEDLRASVQGKPFEKLRRWSPMLLAKEWWANETYYHHVYREEFLRRRPNLPQGFDFAIVMRRCMQDTLVSFSEIPYVFWLILILVILANWGRAEISATSTSYQWQTATMLAGVSYAPFLLLFIAYLKLRAIRSQQATEFVEHEKDKGLIDEGEQDKRLFWLGNPEIIVRMVHCGLVFSMWYLYPLFLFVVPTLYSEGLDSCLPASASGGLIFFAFGSPILSAAFGLRSLHLLVVTKFIRRNEKLSEVLEEGIEEALVKKGKRPDEAGAMAAAAQLTVRRSLIGSSEAPRPHPHKRKTRTGHAASFDVQLESSITEEGDVESGHGQDQGGHGGVHERKNKGGNFEMTLMRRPSE